MHHNIAVTWDCTTETITHCSSVHDFGIILFLFNCILHFFTTQKKKIIFIFFLFLKAVENGMEFGWVGTGK